MRKNKDAIRAASEVDQDFPRFLKQVRTEEKVLLQQLAEGLMTVSQLARIEKGERSVGKDMRDQLLGRLGIASDLYENLLNNEDYKAWEQKRNILCAIEQREFLRAKELLAVYEKQESDTVIHKIKQQFCFVMRAEILRQQGADSHEIGVCYEKAVKLTVPDVECACIARKLLSVQEINMILEYEYYHKDEDYTEKCRELMTYVENSAYDDLSKVKIYPKIVYYYLREILSSQEEQTAEKLSESLQICNQAVEMLRDTGRAYYLLEILEIRIAILECIEKGFETGVEAQELEMRKTTLRESKELALLLKALSEEYSVPAYMQDCTYLYQQRWMFYVGDVLRIRRKMYGLTQKELCGRDCSVRTLRRTEKGEANMQHEALGILLRKLGLSKEFQRACLVSNDREVLKMREEIAVCRNNYELGKARELLGQMRTRVTDQIPENRQYFLELQASLDWMDGIITREEFLKREEEALRCTLNVSDLYQMNEVYLTQMEMSCIRRRIEVLENSEKRKCIDFLIHFFIRHEKKNTLADSIIIYEFIIVCIMNELGNMGEYQLSIDLGKKILKESLIHKRVLIIADSIYNILWDANKQKLDRDQPIERVKMTEKLQQCIILSHFCKQTYDEKFYCNKMNQVR